MPKECQYCEYVRLSPEVGMNNFDKSIFSNFTDDNHITYWQQIALNLGLTQHDLTQIERAHEIQSKWGQRIALFTTFEIWTSKTKHPRWTDLFSIIEQTKKQIFN